MFGLLIDMSFTSSLPLSHTQPSHSVRHFTPLQASSHKHLPLAPADSTSPRALGAEIRAQDIAESPPHSPCPHEDPSSLLPPLAPTLHKAAAVPRLSPAPAVPPSPPVSPGKPLLRPAPSP